MIMSRYPRFEVRDSEAIPGKSFLQLYLKENQPVLLGSGTRVEMWDLADTIRKTSIIVAHKVCEKPKVDWELWMPEVIAKQRMKV